MAPRNFKKEEFVKDGDRYKVEFKIKEIGEGVDLIVERRRDDGEYELIQAEISRMNDSIFIFWSEPIDGRVVSDEYKQL
ncbi:glutathione synthase [Chryseobacterium daecheongense]|uniref:Glutathione synthase n=1 Tax=Chryseobacterium daecheongense TaxID=192389 RepID=A0A3N0W4K6_9FLAO|nr:glutathione synthase [Chryseobacterium daecheongense]ROI00004.1 glutathione synthase [Chryseobacterium daecheongense]TDX95061.1 hypothetical protein BCF50_0836 [Chryseobacterium daecheongense]